MNDLTWQFYKWTMTNKGGHCISHFEKVGRVNGWPTLEFATLAERLGFPELNRDGSIVGGYYANSDGECLIVLPADWDPYQYHDYNGKYSV